MIHPQALIKLFGYNFELITKQLKEVTHEESLLQPPDAGNSLNWLLGHLISSRTFPLRYVGEQPAWTEEQRARYRSGNLPITADGVGVAQFDELFTIFAITQDRLIHGLSRLTYEDMCQPSGYENNTLGDSLGYFHFHEAHHTGHILSVAQFLGKPEVWIS